MRSSLLYLGFLVGPASGCIRTAGSTGPTVPTIPAMPSTTVATTEAATRCDSCTNDEISTAVTGTNGKAFASDVTSTSGMCLTRTLTCTGNSATITVNGGANAAIGDGGTGSVTTTAVCADNGMDWLIDGVNTPITQLECTAAAAGGGGSCQACPMTGIMILMNQVGAVEFDSITFDLSTGCLTETFVCTGPMVASVQANDGDGGSVTDASQGTPGTVKLTATCQSDGMTWLIMGIPITALECDNLPM